MLATRHSATPAQVANADAALDIDAVAVYLNAAQ
jgi:hypothetical protein